MNEFFQLSPKEFYFAVKVKNERETERIKFNHQRQYEIARFHAVLVINPTLKKSDQIKDPSAQYPFPWEKKAEPQTMEQMKMIMMGIARTSKKKKSKHSKK